MKTQLVIGAPKDKQDSPGATELDYLDATDKTSPLVFSGQSNIYIEAGTAVANLAQQIRQLLPICQQTELSAGMSSFFFSLQFTWAVEAIPRLRGWLTLAAQYPKVVLWDCPIPTDALASLAPGLGALERRYSDLSTKVAAQLADYERQLANNPSPELGKAQATGLPLIVLGSPVDVTLGAAYLNHAGLAGPCQVLLKRNEPKLVAELERACPQIQVTQVFFSHLLLPPNADCCWQLWQAYQQLNEPGAAPLAPLISPMLQAIWTARALQHLVANIQPKIIFGTFEKSPLGVVLSDPGTTGDYQLISYQHGIMSTTQTLHYLRFSKFYVWNRLFAQLVENDGYAPAESLEVLDLRPNGTDDPTFHPLHLLKPRWVPRGLVVVVFEQPLQKSPMDAADYGGLLTELNGLASQLGFSCLVKPHPSTYNVNDLSVLSENLPKVKRLDQSISLHQVLVHADIAVGMTSTALVDFMRVGKPAISFDPKRWAELAGIPAGLFSYRATNNGQLAEQLQSIVNSAKPRQRFAAALRTRRPN